MNVPGRWSLLPPQLIDRIEDSVNHSLGFTLALAAVKVRESRTEHPWWQERDIRNDAVGKHLHYLRHKKGWGPLADLAWRRLRRIAEQNVDIVLEIERMI